MRVLKRLPLRASHTTILIGLTLFTSGLFKISAFAREAFIAAKFGLSSATDAYFGLQQLPLTIATFMFGSFALAFTPMYAEARRRSGTVSWLPGLTYLGIAMGLLLTLAMIAAAPLLLRLLVPRVDAQTWNTLVILSVSLCPIVWIGIWSGICTAHGQNLWAMSLTGLPYLVMTLVLLAFYAARSLNELSLPISLSAGFSLIGIYALFRILRTPPTGAGNLKSVISVWRAQDFRSFLRQLVASSVENSGFAANQLLLVYFLARTGTGRISANNCAMRIGMLGYGLLTVPLAQLVQARLCTARRDHRTVLLRDWLFTIAAGAIILALAIYGFRDLLIRLVYMHGKFGRTQLDEVEQMLTPWVAYFVVMSVNAIVARYLFTSLKGSAYVRNMLYAYAAANLLRFLLAGQLKAPWIIWCSVIAEACAFLCSLRSCFVGAKSRDMVPVLARTTSAAS